MKSSTIIILAIFLLTSISKSFAKFENNIILKVENEIITNFEIKNKIISTLILGDQEINLMACLVEIMSNAKFK